MVYRWTNILISDGEKEYRNRVGGIVDDVQSKQQLVSIWDTGWQMIFTTLNDLKTDNLLKNIRIRGINTLLLKRLRDRWHHVEQIVFIGKLIKNKNW